MSTSYPEFEVTCGPGEVYVQDNRPTVTNGHRRGRSWIILSEIIVAQSGTIKMIL
ncbi:MAG: hypothetical protein M3146_06720 [Thermoproteota archaeon]|nr:hypothetical protein [Thermoproteota archaeon]